MSKTSYTCTGCIPIDKSIVDTYVALLSADKSVEEAEEARVEAEAGRVEAETARASAEASRVIAEDAREATSSADHTVAVSDHTTAVADHATAEGDHTTATSDHTSSVAATEAAGVATARANDAAAAAEHMVDIKTGPQGPQGNTGSSVDYPYELVNNVTTDDATKGLSAAQGVVLDGKVSQLGQKIIRTILPCSEPFDQLINGGGSGGMLANVGEASSAEVITWIRMKCPRSTQVPVYVFNANKELTYATTINTLQGDHIYPVNIDIPEGGGLAYEFSGGDIYYGDNTTQKCYYWVNGVIQQQLVSILIAVESGTEVMDDVENLKSDIIDIDATLDDLIGGTTPTPILTPEVSFDQFTETEGSGGLMANTQVVSEETNIRYIKVKAPISSANVPVYTFDSLKQLTLVDTIDIQSGTHTYDVNITIPSGGGIAMYFGAGAINFRDLSDGIFYWDKDTLAYVGMAAVELAIEVGTYNETGTIPELQQDVERLDDRVSILENEGSPELFSFDFTKSLSGQETNILTGGWNASLASANGYAIQSGFANKVLINRYSVLNDIRYIALIHLTDLTCNFCLSSVGAVLHGYGGASVVSFDFENSQIKIYENSGGNTIPSTIKYTLDISSVIDGNDYYVIVGRETRKLYAEIINYKTNSKLRLTATDDSNIGDGGYLYDKLAFSQISGSQIYVKKLSCYIPYDVFALIVGDSITQGYAVAQEDTYSQKLANYFGNSVIAARSSADATMAANILLAIGSKMRPKVAIVTIGTNEGLTLTQAQAFVAICKTIGAKLVLNHIPNGSRGVPHVQSVNSVVEAIGTESARFDIATSVNNVVTDGYDSSLFVDGLHPNAEGHESMYNRFLSDVNL